MRDRKGRGYTLMGTHGDKKKSHEQVNIEQNLRREVKKDLRNVELWVKHSNTYIQWRELGILGSKTKDEL